MTQAEHTPEPWVFSDILDNDNGGIVTEDNRIIIGSGPGRYNEPNLQRVADCYRIVACVNALRGLSPEAIPAAIEALEEIATGKVTFQSDVVQSTTMFLRIAELQGIAAGALAAVKATPKGAPDG